MNTDGWMDINLKVLFLNFSNASENMTYNDTVMKYLRMNIQLQEF